MSTEIYPCYVRIGDEKDEDELVELPTEKDGTMLLSTIQAQYPEAIGLRFKSDSGAWRGVRSSEKVLDPPLEGWRDVEYYITRPKPGSKRKFEDDDDAIKNKKMSDREMLSDLIVLGLPYTATEEDIKAHFEQFGELDMYEIKFDPGTKKSRGFGFIRYKKVEAVEKVLAATHIIMNRRCEVRFPKKERDQQQDDNPTKLFVGRLPRGCTSEDLREHFCEYGVLKDVYIPNPFRGFGFVTFGSQSAAVEVLNSTHVIKGGFVNVSHPTPKNQEEEQQQKNMFMQQNQFGYGNMQGRPGQGYGNQGPQGQGFGNQGPFGFGNQGPPGYGNQGKFNGYGGGYFQQGIKMQGGNMGNSMGY